MTRRAGSVIGASPVLGVAVWLAATAPWVAVVCAVGALTVAAFTACVLAGARLGARIADR